MNTEKKLMNNRKFLAITIPFAALCLALAIAVPILANAFSPILNTYLGAGEVIISGEDGVDYYEIESKTSSESHLAARDLTKEIAEEGIILMKNDDVLPLDVGTQGSVTLFGRRSVESVYGGKGSGAINEELCDTLRDGLEAVGFEVNDTVYSMYEDNLDKVEVASMAMDNPQASTYYIGEFPQSYYTADVRASYSSYNDAAIVVFGRQGGEGYDFCPDLKGTLDAGTSAMSSSVPETAYYESGQHQLELSKEERDLIEHVKANFSTVIVVINSANVMELGDLAADKTASNLGVDAILWCGAPGTTGMAALGEVLCGNVNPSGRTVDTWVNDLTQEPSFNNYVSAYYTNIQPSQTADNANAYFMDYEEGIYVGYRYYETAYAEALAGNYDGFDYDSLVTYPFGYGLSYTTFDWEILSDNVATAAQDGEIVIDVQVTNTGDVAGKDVVQLYATPPYDPATGVEKAAKNLVAYAKTPLIEAGKSETVTLTFSVQDMASYDYRHANADGTTGCYFLEEGEYILTLQTDSHNAKASCSPLTYALGETVYYDSSNPRESEIEAQTGASRNLSEEAKQSLTVEAAVNRFEYMNEHFRDYDETQGGTAVNFSRADFAASFPTAPTGADLIAPQSVIDDFAAYEPDYYDSSDTKPTTGADNGLNLVQMRGLSYDDPLWDDLLDQLSLAEMSNLILNGQYSTAKVSSINKPSSVELDGPAGITLYGALSKDESNNGYCCGTMLASTWNPELARRFGESVGEEAAWYKNGNKKVLNGWYAPGMNMHRTSFSGRNFEYYSEDPLLSGTICKGTVEGAASKGVYTFVKHFVLNDVDMNRKGNGLAAWVNEQALREIYLKPFEIVVTQAETELAYIGEDGEMTTKTIRACTALMSTYTRLGSKPDASSGELNEILRGEWGFMGTVITDSNVTKHTHVEDCFVNLSDLQLTASAIVPTKITDTSNASTQQAMRNACKNILYTTVHSNLMNGISAGSDVTEGMAPWMVYIILIEVFVVLVFAALIAISILHTIAWRKRVTVAVLIGEPVSPDAQGAQNSQNAQTEEPQKERQDQDRQDKNDK